MMDNRRGPTYAILEAPSQTLEYNIAARNRSLSKMGLLRNASICKFIARYSAPLKLNWVQSAAGGQRCEFLSAEPWSPPSTLELVMQNNQIAKEFGLRLDPTTCKTFAAHLGDKPFPYQWCRVLPLEAQN